MGVGDAIWNDSETGFSARVHRDLPTLRIKKGHRNLCYLLLTVSPEILHAHTSQHCTLCHTTCDTQPAPHAIMDSASRNVNLDGASPQHCADTPGYSRQHGLRRSHGTCNRLPAAPHPSDGLRLVRQVCEACRARLLAESGRARARVLGQLRRD